MVNYQNRKILFLYLITFYAFSSCKNEINPLSINEIEFFIYSKSFLKSCKYNSIDEILNLNVDKTFTRISRGRRSNESIFYSGRYEILESKFNDTGIPYVYLKLFYTDNRWTNVPEYCIFDKDNLVFPEYSGETAERLNLKVGEDRYGLNIPNYLIKGATACEIAYASDRNEIPNVNMQSSLKNNSLINQTSGNDSSRVMVDSSSAKVVQSSTNSVIYSAKDAKYFLLNASAIKNGKIKDEFISNKYGHSIFTFLVAHGNDVCKIIISDIKLEILEIKCNDAAIQAFYEAKRATTAANDIENEITTGHEILSESENDIRRKAIIANHIRAEDAKDLSTIFKYYSTNMTQYYDIKLPQTEDLEKRYNHYWSIISNPKSVLKSVKKLSTNIYLVTFDYEYYGTKLNTHRIIQNEITYYVFDNDNRIMALYDNNSK